MSLSECIWIFIANYGVVAPTEWSLLAWRLGVRVVGIGFIGFVMADDAAGRSAHFPVTGHVAGYAAHDSAFDAPFCIGARDRRYRDSSYASCRKNPLHGVSSNSEGQFGQAKTVPAVLLQITIRSRSAATRLFGKILVASASISSPV